MPTFIDEDPVVELEFLNANGHSENPVYRVVDTGETFPSSEVEYMSSARSVDIFRNGNPAYSVAAEFARRRRDLFEEDNAINAFSYEAKPHGDTMSIHLMRIPRKYVRTEWTPKKKD